MDYDSKIIVEFANRLYSKANTIIVIYTILGIILGAIAGSAASSGSAAAMAIGALILGAIGYSLGSERAFQLKLQAQTALCQVQIEKNTRVATPAEAKAPTISAIRAE